MKRLASLVLVIMLAALVLNVQAFVLKSYPEDTVTAEWDVFPASYGYGHHLVLAEDRDSLDTGDWVFTEFVGERDEYEMTSFDLAGRRVQQVDLHVSGEADPTLNAEASIYMGEWLESKPLEFSTSGPGWRKLSWQGSWDQADFDDLRVGLTAVGSGSEVDVFGLYADIIYGEGTPVLFLDVGNDTDYEWGADDTFRGPERLTLTGAINHYVRGGCWCVGCVLDGGSGNCTVPIVIKADMPGNLTVNDVDLTFSRSRSIAEVGYGQPFRRGGGGCWRVEHSPPGGGEFVPEGGVAFPVPEDYDGADCNAEVEHLYSKLDTSPPNTDDAVDDAMYRLLNNTLDVNEDGILDIAINENMSFQSEGRIGVQTLWGPVQMRLVVWS
ncbi:MAG: hypothetical protein GF416_00350 [Candidatus Altiarchaeales archaeon]|nr:hypothetical protein [Candidatus Altiarchaeales archaeon]MBD3415570.1 hypothetical protein [Candidatus Altiarchaeales archaeon]